MNMVQSTDRRVRSRAARRDAFLDATRDLIEEHGIEALTIKAVAARVDCAVGTLYTYFRSKGALLAALQAEAITRLGQSYDRASDRLEDDLAVLDVDTAALARLVAFGRSLVGVATVLPEEFRLQQRLLSAQTGYDEADLALVAPVAFSVLSRPERLLREAAALGVLADGDAFDRTLTWVAAVNGVLALASVEWPGGEGFDPATLADALHLDLLRAWGARPEVLAAAEAAVPRVRVTGLLAEADG